MEKEGSFVERISRFSRQCCHVLTKSELLNYYVRRLHLTTREGDSQQLKLLPEMQSYDLSVVRQITLSIGRSHRALMDQQPPKTSQSQVLRPLKAKPTMFVVHNIHHARIYYVSVTADGYSHFQFYT